MRNLTILVIVSLLALVALIAPSALFLAGRIDLPTTKWAMLIATIVWFVSATPWLWKQTGQSGE
jgi:hypothetical protein